ncbi:long-chain-fatty-acid--CoA ligase [Rhodococcus triatomae BKS 15-14]|nr:long-chain-fatty-acid--CoA ligase [Rhodococcus triatomae BKS 15-14]
MAGSDRVLTYAQLADRSARLASVFREAGLQPGDTVALLTDNTPEAYEVYWGAVRSGLYVTAVNRHLTAPEVAYIVTDSGASALLVSGRLPELAHELLELVPTLRARLAFGAALSGYDDYESALAQASPEVPADQPCGADVLYTSGTTSRPKGIRQVLPTRQVDEPGNPVVELACAALGFREGMVYLSPAPIYHAAPLRFSTAVHAVGGTVVMMDKFEPHAALAAIDEHRVTHSQWVPTMFVRMLKLPETSRAGYDLSSHEVAVHAAAPCPVEVKYAMIDWWGPILYEYYAATEGNGSTVIDSEQWLSHPGSVGRPVQGIIRICGDDGLELTPGQVGEVFFERDEVPFAYLGDQSLTTAAQHPHYPTWTTTGDVGRVDEEGFLYLTDRKSFLIISGGVNISPQEIEDALIVHPSVADAAVIGVPHPDMGEEVRGVVVPAHPHLVGEEAERDLIDYLSGRLARYKVPRHIDFVSELPRTPTGKLVKRLLRSQYT